MLVIGLQTKRTKKAGIVGKYGKLLRSLFIILQYSCDYSNTQLSLILLLYRYQVWCKSA
jgi:hypothetical protein